jgi:hypothetical protein
MDVEYEPNVVVIFTEGESDEEAKVEDALNILEYVDMTDEEMI